MFVDDDRDPYNQVKSWWNRSGAESCRTPRESLFALLGLAGGSGAGSYSVGKGTLVFDGSSPAALSYRPDGAARVREAGPRRPVPRPGSSIVRPTTSFSAAALIVIGVGLEGCPVRYGPRAPRPFHRSVRTAKSDREVRQADPRPGKLFV